MCGRYSNDLPPGVAARMFRATNNVGEFRPRYNAAPTQELPVVRYNPETRERTLDLLRWGLVPHWANDLSIGNKLINARAETVARTPSFRDAFARRRCIVPAKGFYEWEKMPKGKQPHAIVPKKTGAPFAIAEWCSRTLNARDVHERIDTVLESKGRALRRSKSGPSF